MKRSATRWVFGLVSVGLVAAAVGTWLVRREAGPRVAVVTPVRAPLVQTLVTSGRVVQRRQSSLGAVVQTTVAEVLVDEGARVEAGELLARFADAEALAAIAEAEAAVEEAEARLRGVRTSGRRLAAEALDAARTEAERAEAEYLRQRRLFETGAVSEAALERTRQERDAARSRRVTASLQVAQAAPSGSDTATAAATLARAQARLRQAQAAYEHTRLRAPFEGVVLTRDVEPGQVVGPGTALFVVAGEGALEVRVSPDESNLASLAVGQPALVSPEAFPSRRLSARVDRIAPSIDPVRGTVDVVLALDEADADLRPDMTVAVEIEVGRADGALALPTSLVRDLGGPRPWVLVARDGVAVRVDVRIGLEGDGLVEIAEGLDESSDVLSPELSLDEDDPVRVRRRGPAVEAARRANGRGANAEGASAQGANGRGADAEGANAEGANAEGANGRGADAEGANVEGANAEAANAEGANAEGANERAAAQGAGAR
ncbi:MAG: efflux RND transporter periplasmic adaptor subunit [Myxococcales bacterium]|nr:efflux RND transporter periplasmic adaptor subunit [Myxococcales bacterium]